MPTVSPSERKILDGLLDGLSNKAIANRVGCAESTVKMHLQALCRRFGVANRTGLALAVMEDLPRRIAALTAQNAALLDANNRLRRTNADQKTQIATLERALSILSPMPMAAQRNLTNVHAG